MTHSRTAETATIPHHTPDEPFRGQIQSTSLKPSLAVRNHAGETVLQRSWPAEGFDHDAATRELLQSVIGLLGSERVAAVGHLAPIRPIAAAIGVPDYLNDIYWWTYVHPRAVWVFERWWLVNLILWGKYVTMRDAVLAEMGETLPGRSLQIACVYGDLTPQLAARVPEGSQLDVVDVLSVQLRNLAHKLPPDARVKLMQMNSAKMADIADATYDRALLFFLLHEMPVDVREATLREAIRVLKPGGKLVLVDFAKPVAWHPLKFIWHPVLKVLEPFAPDLFSKPIDTWLPESHRGRIRSGKGYFGNFYQMMVVQA